MTQIRELELEQAQIEGVITFLLECEDISTDVKKKELHKYFSKHNLISLQLSCMYLKRIGG